jgi:hypothetical protein
MPRHLAATAILCRPNQLVEAAVAVTSLPMSGTPVVLTLDPASVTSDAYRADYQRYVDARHKSMERATGRAYRKPGGWTSEDFAEWLPLAAEQAATRLELTEPRSWLRRNERYRRL